MAVQWRCAPSLGREEALCAPGTRLRAAAPLSCRPRVQGTRQVCLLASGGCSAAQICEVDLRGLCRPIRPLWCLLSVCYVVLVAWRSRGGVAHLADEPAHVPLARIVHGPMVR